MVGYQNSKMNAQKWGTAIEGPMTCRQNCPYRQYHETICCPDGQLHVGRPCLVDLVYGNAYAASMREQHPLLVEHRNDDFEALVCEAVKIALLRERIRCRSNRAWDLGRDMYPEFDLCHRYWVAMHRRYLRLLDDLEALTDDVRAELEDKRMKTFALSSCIGSKDVPEPYRSWAVEQMRLYREAQAAR